MKLRAQSYYNLDGTQLERATAAASVSWYWRILAIASSAMILGGFLMLTPTFNQDPQTRFSVVGLGTFAAVVLGVGFCCNACICFIVHNLPYLADAVLTPALVSCLLGLSNVLYCFAISPRYVINVPSILTLVVSGMAAVAYGTLLTLANKKINQVRAMPVEMTAREEPVEPPADAESWQSPQYYQNYVQNMFPSASPQPQHVAAQSTSPIPEDELLRQQMLMLFLNPASATTPQTVSNTFRIEWQGQDQDQEPNTPVQGYFGARQSDTAHPAISSATLQVPGHLKPWDGVWRGIAQRSKPDEASREARRREIEMGA